MITPPTPLCYYTVSFERAGARTLLHLLTKTDCKDIESAIIFSADITSDLTATAELRDGASAVLSKMADKFSEKLEFNPLFLPIRNEDLEENIELDYDGDIKTIAGFSSPYVILKLTFATEDDPDILSGSLNYKKFQLPSYQDMLNTSANPS